MSFLNCSCIVKIFDFSYTKIKVTRIDKESMDTLVLSESMDDVVTEIPYITLWSIPFSFSEMRSDDEFVIQNNAHLIPKECCEMSKRREYIEKGMTLEEANEACRVFFIRTKTFEQIDRQTSKKPKGRKSCPNKRR